MIKYRLAEEKDYQKINNFFNRIYSSNRTIAQFYWEFHDGPFGKAIYVIAEDGDTLVGTNCVIPINVINDKQQIVRTGKSEDTLVDPAYRGQKIFYHIYEYLIKVAKEHGIKVIWGFTSAIKPFEKIGFSIPFSTKSNLIVHNITASYQYFLGTKKNPSLKVRLKLLLICLMAKTKQLLVGKSTIAKKYEIIKSSEIKTNVADLIQSNLGANKNSFAIHQTPEYQSWRLYNNPNYKKVHTFGFYDTEKILKGLIVINAHPDKSGFICQSTFHYQLKEADAIEMIKYATEEVFKTGVALIRSWSFDHNILNKKELDNFVKAKHYHFNKGLGFVWMEIDDVDLDPINFNLSFMASQGVV